MPATRAAEFGLFSRQILRHPRQVSALAPSSPGLAAMMARQLPVTATRVAEFGAGLGSLTRAILAAGIAPQDLTLFEVNDTFCASLRTAFPGVAIVNGPAQRLADAPGGSLDAVVSGLPLLSMPADTQRDILAAAFHALAPDGVYIQFTYGLFAPLRTAIARDLGLTTTRTARVWKNIPPATVHVYRRARNGTA